MNLDIDRIRCGSLIRVRQTALIISGVLGGLSMDIDPLLNERALGEWNRRPIADTENLIDQQATPPGGESEDQFRARVSSALEHLATQSANRPMVVSSKGVGRVINTLLGGEGRMTVSNGEIVEFMLASHADGTPSFGVRRPSFV
jgi:2,3-bisphosphoglycerate-dependent phosphoglycerate mutase